MTDVPHYADDTRRAEYAERCGSRFDDTYVEVRRPLHWPYAAPYRCALKHGHGGCHESEGYHRVRWDDADAMPLPTIVTNAATT